MTGAQFSNWLNRLPNASQGESTEVLLAGEGIRLERIVSQGQVTPAGVWYDQAEDEWVLLLTGAAHLAIEGEPSEHELAPGDSAFLPAGCRHRVTWTDPHQAT